MIHSAYYYNGIITKQNSLRFYMFFQITSRPQNQIKTGKPGINTGIKLNKCCSRSKESMGLSSTCLLPATNQKITQKKN